MLTEEQREEIVEVLTANVNTRAGQAWRDVDLDEASDQELVAFNELLEVLRPTTQPISCPCGRTHTYNEQRKGFVTSGTPKAQRGPTTVAELITNGGGTPEERETWEFAANHLRNHKSQLLEQLTANMTDQEREAAWNDYQGMSLPELEKLVKRFGRTQAPTPHLGGGSYFGQQGPSVTANQLGGVGSPAIEERPLELVQMDFAPRWNRDVARGTN